jgi:hypothetical protein
VRAELKKMKADDTEKKLKISDAAKVVAAKWKTMSDEEKLKWKREKPEESESTGVIVGITGMPGPPPSMAGMMAMGTPMMPGVGGMGGMGGMGGGASVGMNPPVPTPAPPPHHGDGPPLGGASPPVPAPQVPLAK